MTETTGRIRWETGQWGNLVGYAGTVEPWVFQIWHIQDNGYWPLISSLPGLQNKDSYRYRDDPDALRDLAERWLAGFVASLGAVFPEKRTCPSCYGGGTDGSVNRNDCPACNGTGNVLRAPETTAATTAREKE